MVRYRLPRFDLQIVVWAVAAAALAVATGVLVAHSPLLAFDLALLAVGVALVARYPFPALLIILLSRGVAPNTPLLDGVTLVAVGLAVALAAPRFPGKRIFVPLAIFLAVAILSTPLAPTVYEGLKEKWLTTPYFGWPYARNPSVPLYEWMRLASGLAIFCLAGWVVYSRRKLEIVVLAILASSVVPIAIGLKQFALGETVARSGQGDSFRAVIGPFSTPGPFSFYLMLVLVLAIVVFLEARSVARRVALGFLIAGGGACLLLTYTRSTWIAFALALIALAALRYRRLVAVGLVGLLIAAVGAPKLVDTVQERFGDLTSRNEARSGNSLEWRRDNWSAILPYGYAKPFTGEGFGSYPRLTVAEFGTQNRRYPTIANPRRPATSSRGFLAHNDYVRTFVELGVPGLALWIAVLVGLLGLGFRARRTPELSAFGAAGVGIALGLAVIGFSDNLLSAPVMLYAFAFFGALAGAEARLGLRSARASAAVRVAHPERTEEPVGVTASTPPDVQPERRVHTDRPPAAEQRAESVPETGRRAPFWRRWRRR